MYNLHIIYTGSWICLTCSTIQGMATREDCRESWGLFVEVNLRQMVFRGTLATNNIQSMYIIAKTTFASLKSFSIPNLFHTYLANLHCYRAISVGQQVNCWLLRTCGCQPRICFQQEPAEKPKHVQSLAPPKFTIISSCLLLSCADKTKLTKIRWHPGHPTMENIYKHVQTRASPHGAALLCCIVSRPAWIAMTSAIFSGHGPSAEENLLDCAAVLWVPQHDWNIM